MRYDSGSRSERTLVAAFAIGKDGRKMILGIREGAMENGTVAG